MRLRIVCDGDAYAELFLQRLGAGRARRFEYRLAYVVEGRRMLHYRSEAGSGGRRLAEGSERSYAFTTPEKLMADFWRDVARCSA